MVELEHTRQMLCDMGLATAAELLDAHLEKAVHEETTYIGFLDDLLTRWEDMGYTFAPLTELPGL